MQIHEALNERGLASDTLRAFSDTVCVISRKRGRDPEFVTGVLGEVGPQWCTLFRWQDGPISFRNDSIIRIMEFKP